MVITGPASRAVGVASVSVPKGPVPEGQGRGGEISLRSQSIIEGDWEKEVEVV